ncbi:ABC transporter permease [Cellulomonas fimi]|uniref:Inner-membrane translocator n=1 Tax=Cellulomonas fimi (strain ATCC 484 / DSM 20113 / JCM 1341 / CCUG 24087 / LMG 16345 / NBRC 15513 / NCIMB 8980 / NCTC 7547 / NRS-133) TaxID=590998 RepID=F4H824_CELFA|nr:ABC transporter permease [Cellulomonas fimi]AEE46985.1 inner-membrane translocator [Cellulomonas fimi ATCC 484]NNH07518.1 ABC transporter permease [Cellulomonas fimi]VEH34767.1 D-allose transporter subunit [Cellulomonas fimi]
MSGSTQPTTPVVTDAGGDDAAKVPDTRDSRWGDAFQRVVSGGWAVSLGAVVLAVLAGSIMIAFTDEGVQEASQYFFARPGDTLAAIGQAVGGAYAALFRGAVYDFRADDFATGIRPLTQSLTYATPLIAAGLGVALAFRAGMFNIGGLGQMLAAAAGAGWVGFAFDLPAGVHLVVALVVGILAGALWAGIAGVLKATTGAHEVIVTIMLNYVAFYLLSYLLATPGLLQAPGSANPKSPPMKDTAVLPDLLGARYALHLGFLLALVAVVVVWWLLNRSSAGFAFRAIGENPHAARVAGIHVPRTTVLAMVTSGALIGLAGATQVLGLITTGFGSDIDAGIGFDAITVALLGGSNPVGVLFASLLFGAFKAGGSAMQASQRIPIEIVLVVQSLIVLFIAAPPLVRAVFRLPQPDRKRPAPRRTSKKTQDTTTAVER